MIQDLTFGGSYRDENISMEAMLVNPAEHGYDYNVLTFEVYITMKGVPIDLYAWKFYIIDSQKNIYNAADIEKSIGNSASIMNMFITYHFRPEYLYNDIRLGFLYEPYNCIEFVEINH